MALRTLHLCQFQFSDQDIRRVGSVTDGGQSLSGLTDLIESDGGGYWRADFTNGQTRTREDGLAWRAIGDGLDGGAQAVDLLFCERLFAPTGAIPRVPHSDQTPFADGSEYVTTSGAPYTLIADAALRATTVRIAGSSPLPLIGGETFSIAHPTWGNRAYRIIAIDGDAYTIRPPLREAATAGTALDFDNPRCQMHLAPGFALSNATNIGRYGSCAISLVEDMRKPK